VEVLIGLIRASFRFHFKTQRVFGLNQNVGALGNIYPGEKKEKFFGLMRVV